MDYIYFLHDRTTKAIKIGCSKNPEQRMKDIIAMIPGDAVPLRYVQVDGNGFDVESALHIKFHDLRIKGEWFRDNSELIDFANTGKLPSVSYARKPRKNNPKSVFLIKDIADLAGVSIRTVRYYIAEGLVHPPMTFGKHSRYDMTHVDTIKNIQAMKKDGMSLAAIKIAWVSSKEVASQTKRVTTYEIMPGVIMMIDDGISPHHRGFLIQAFSRISQQVRLSKQTNKGERK